MCVRARVCRHSRHDAAAIADDLSRVAAGVVITPQEVARYVSVFFEQAHLPMYACTFTALRCTRRRHACRRRACARVSLCTPSPLSRHPFLAAQQWGRAIRRIERGELAAKDRSLRELTLLAQVARFEVPISLQMEFISHGSSFASNQPTAAILRAPLYTGDPFRMLTRNVWGPTSMPAIGTPVSEPLLAAARGAQVTPLRPEDVFTWAQPWSDFADSQLLGRVADAMLPSTSAHTDVRAGVDFSAVRGALLSGPDFVFDYWLRSRRASQLSARTDELLRKMDIDSATSLPKRLQTVCVCVGVGG